LQEYISASPGAYEVSDMHVGLIGPFFKKRFIAQTVHTGCTRINYKIFTVTNLNKYLHNGTSGTE